MIVILIQYPCAIINMRNTPQSFKNHLILKENEQVGVYEPSPSFSPSISSTKRVNPFSNVGEIVVSDSEEDEVVNTFDEFGNLFDKPPMEFLSSTGGGHELEDDYFYDD